MGDLGCARCRRADSAGVLASRLLADINTVPADNASDAPEGLHALMQTDWPRGTVLTRAHLEAARDNQPWPGE